LGEAKNRAGIEQPDRRADADLLFGKSSPTRGVHGILERPEGLAEPRGVFRAHRIANAKPRRRLRHEPGDECMHAAALRSRQETAAVDRGLPVVHEMDDQRQREAALDVIDKLHQSGAAEDRVNQFRLEFHDPRSERGREDTAFRQAIAEDRRLEPMERARRRAGRGGGLGRSGGRARAQPGEDRPGGDLRRAEPIVSLANIRRHRRPIVVDGGNTILRPAAE